MQTTSLFLITPVLDDVADFAPVLAAACRTGEVAAVLARLAGSDERALVNAVKALGAAVQPQGAALVVALPDAADPVAIAVRGGADGLHVAGPAEWRDLRGRLKDGRSLGAGGLRTRDDAMAAGEAGADYVLFGEPKPDGWVPPLEDRAERAEWWAAIFETPCVVVAATLDEVAVLAATGAEFVGLGDAVWSHPDGPEAALAAARSAARVPEPAL